MKVSMKTLVPTAMIALSAMTIISCGSKEDNRLKTERNIITLAPYDSTRANLPIIEGNRVFFRNEDNDIVVIKSADDANGQITQSLYKAIRKFSTSENPYITEFGKFYSEVSNDIPKIFQSSKFNSDIHNSYHALIQGFFDQLYNIYAEDDSSEGAVITVKEYTEMMQAWSSTGIREY